jgi:hypothetical protein
MAQHHQTNTKSSMKVKRVRVGGKPLRLATPVAVLYPISLADIRFRQKSVDAMIASKYGMIFSTYQVDVFVVLCQLMDMGYDVSLSYQQIVESGYLRGHVRQDVARSLDKLERIGILERFGMTQSGKYPKYRLTHAGDSLWAWVNREMSAPYEAFRHRSLGFAAPTVNDPAGVYGVEVSAVATTEPDRQ